MQNEYIIINKTELEKRLEKLKKRRETEEGMRRWYYVEGKITEIENILSQSTPLITVVENAYLEGDSNGQLTEEELKSELKDYIDNLKLEI